MALNVRTDGGAVGTGDVDDTQSIQRTLDRAAETTQSQRNAVPVYFPAGMYRVTRTLKCHPYVDLYGEDSSSSILLHDILGLNASDRAANSVCMSIGGDPTTPKHKEVKGVTIRRLGFKTTEPRLVFAGDADDHRQTAFFALGCIYGCILQEVEVYDFNVGMHLRQCWTAKVKNCYVAGAGLHCLKWENANAGEISGCRFDSYWDRGRDAEGKGDSAVFVSYSPIEPRYETLSLLVQNNSFQNSERAGFYGRGIGDLTMINNYYQNNNRFSGSKYAALCLDRVLKERDKEIRNRVATIIGGFISSGTKGQGDAISIRAYDIATIIGCDIRGGFRNGIDVRSKNTNLTLIGVHSAMGAKVDVDGEYFQKGCILGPSVEELPDYEFEQIGFEQTS